MNYILVIAVVMIGAWYLPVGSTTSANGLSLLSSEANDDGSWRHADGSDVLRFPVDHGPHRDFRTEWWYLVMHLADEQGEQFAAQWTVFRQAMPADTLKEDHADDSQESASWAYEDHYLGHLSWLAPGMPASLTRHMSLRGSPQWAGSSAQQVWCGPMRLSALDQPSWELSAPAGDGHLDLRLTPTREPILHGDQGWSRKDADGAASYYYSFTRMKVVGTWRSDSQTIALSGSAWFDHEWFSGGLGRQLSGWDWWCWRLDNGDDLMLGWLRDPDGQRQGDFTGTWRRADGTTEPIPADEISVIDTTWWSTADGRRYPLARELQVKGYHVRVEPWVSAQYHGGTIPYWEGAVDLIDVATGKVIGQGFQELTGY